MFKKYVSLMLVLILALTAFVGCASTEKKPKGEEPAEEMILKWNMAADPKTIDPQLNSASDGGHIINNTFEGLMREVNEKIEPAMAESYEISADGLTYTFYLRDAKWSDGQPVTAGDFEYAWKRALDPNLVSGPADYALQLFYIKGAQEYFEKKGKVEDVAIRALDDKTLEVILSAPTPYFLELTAFYTYMPVRKDMVEKDPENWARNPETAISNGPFKLAEYTTGDRIILQKNENYWRADKVKLDRIEAAMIVDPSTALATYEAGDLDAMDEVPNQEIPRLKAEDTTFEILPQLGTYFYVFNVMKEPTDNYKVRKALTLAIDRKAIVENVTQAGQIPADGYVPYGLKDADGREFRDVAGNYGIDGEKANVEEARKLLAEAGYPEGKGFPEIEIIYNTNDNHKAIAEAIQEMWKKNLGIRVKITNQEWNVFQSTRHQGNFTVARDGWTADYADPMTFLDMWTTYSGSNNAQWMNKEYDQLIEGSKVATGAERFKLLYDAEKMMMDDLIVMPIYFYTDPTMVKEYVRDWEKTPLGYWFFGYASIEK